MRDDDGQGTQEGKVSCQLSVPGSGQVFIKTLMTFTSEGTFMVFQNLFNAVTDTPVSAVLVTGNDEDYSDRQVVMRNVCQPQAACYRV